MRSIRKSFALLAFVSTALLAIIIGAVSLAAVVSASENNAKQLMNAACALDAAKIDVVIEGIEDAVDIETDYVQSKLTDALGIAQGSGGSAASEGTGQANAPTTDTQTADAADVDMQTTNASATDAQTADAIDQAFVPIQGTAGAQSPTSSQGAAQPITPLGTQPADPPTLTEDQLGTLADLFRDVAQNTEGTVLYFMRLNEVNGTGPQGFVYARPGGKGDFEPLGNLDALPGERVGADMRVPVWNRARLEWGVAQWVEPYALDDSDVLVALYVRPIFLQGRCVGVVGMGVDFQIVIDQVAAMSSYDTGYGFLTDALGNVMYHPTIPFGTNLSDDDEDVPAVDRAIAEGTTTDIVEYAYRGANKRMAFHLLQNEMRLVLSVEASEIYAQRDGLVWQLALVATISAIVFVGATLLIGQRLLAPLTALTFAAKRVADGDLDVEILSSDVEELSGLIDSYQRTVGDLRDRLTYIDGLAYRDGLTGAFNKTSYNEERDRIDAQIAAARREAGLAVGAGAEDVGAGGALAEGTGTSGAQPATARAEGSKAQGDGATDAQVEGVEKTDAQVEGAQGSAVPKGASSGGDAGAKPPVFALVMLDVNKLKPVNDTYGHEAGDEYLRIAVAQVMAAFEGCSVYRIGGDEFVVLAEGEAVDRIEDGIAELDEVMRVSADIEEPWRRTSLAIGVAVFDPESDGSVADVFARADAAMYQRKQAMKHGEASPDGGSHDDATVR